MFQMWCKIFCFCCVMWCNFIIFAPPMDEVCVFNVHSINT